MAAADLAKEGREPHSQTPRMLRCVEHGVIEVPVRDLLGADGTLDINPELQELDFVGVYLRKGHALRLQARSHVGLIPLNRRLFVYVRPRMPIHNLERMIRISGEKTTVLASMRWYEAGGEWNDTLTDIYAAALLEHLETIRFEGLWRDYARREATGSFPHGRILLHATLQQLAPRGIRHAAHTTWFERSVDIAANRCLKYAVWGLASRYSSQRTGAHRKILRQLNAAYQLLDAVSLDHERRFLDDPHVSGRQSLPTVRGYYREALDIALAIIEERAVLIDSEGDTVKLPSMVIDMNRVFEGYVRNCLAMQASEREWRFSALDGNTEGRQSLFDDMPSPDATPDVVLKAADGAAPVLLEVKNVPRDGAPKREAINQALTYAVRYRSPSAVIVTPCANSSQGAALRRLGTIAGVSVLHYRFALGAEDLGLEEDRFGVAIGELLSSAAQA